MIGELHNGPSESRRYTPHRRHILSLLAALLGFSTCPILTPAGVQDVSQAVTGISKSAAERCDVKMRHLEEYAAASKSPEKQETRFTEDEINSYLAFYLRDGYHPSLQRLQMRFEENKLCAVAEIDFDQLKTDSQKLLAGLLAGFFSGVHELSLTGMLIARAGMAHFKLEEAHFDSSTLPNFLVEEIISSVGSRQKPPFDPLTPSPIPFGITDVEVLPGQIVVHQ